MARHAVDVGSYAENITRQLAAYSSGLKFQNLPSEIVLVAKQCVLDGLGVMLAGSREPLPKKEI